MKFPVIDIGGSVREAGHMLGSQLKEMLHQMVGQLKEKTESSYEGGWDTFLKRTRIYSAYVENFLPRDHEEMAGTAEGSGLSIEEVYALTCLELREEFKGCTDFVVAGKATVDGGVLACHNEDWERNEQQFLVVRRSRIDGEPHSLSVAYGGIIPSIGFNAAGIALTGNALLPTDKKFGIPKLHLVREIVRSSTLPEALKLCMLQPRASSFNNVLSTREGQIYNFEGSAGEHALTFSDHYSVHTNHYVADGMKKFEANPSPLESQLRYYSAKSRIEAGLGSFTAETCKQVLSIHTNAPSSPCKHYEGNESSSCTVYSAVIDISNLKMEACLGNPCSSEWHLYSLD